MKPPDLGMDGYDISIDSRASILRSFTGHYVFFFARFVWNDGSKYEANTTNRSTALLCHRLFLWFTDVKLRKILVRVSY